MISLIIDTSTEHGLVALFQGNELIYHGKLPFGLQNSKNLFPEIVKCFEKVNLKPKDLNLVISGIGPGSYTGIRVGAVVAKTFSYTLKIPLVGVSSLEAFVPETNEHFASLIDAKIGGVYLSIGEMKDGVLISFSEPALCSLDDALKHLEGVSKIYTPNSSQIGPKLEKLSGTKTLEFVEMTPNPKQMFLSGFKKYQEGSYSLDGHLDLLYLRKTEAEIKRGF